MSSEESKDLTHLCVNAIRIFSAEMPSAANSGHPGAPMGMAPMAHLLWAKYMSYSTNSKWFNRDRFVLSNGHACALLYTMLHLTGRLTLEDCKAFRQTNSKTPGHPENHLTDGVEVTTGPLGQGISNAVGLAIASKHLAATFNKPEFELINNRIWVFVGDGCLQEGISSEASSLAGHLGLSNLIVLYDDNLITIDGHTDLSFSEDVGKRYEAYGWAVFTVGDGNNDMDGLNKAIQEALKVTDRPSLIKVRTIIGFGSEKEGTHGVHGSPLTANDINNIKKKWGFEGKSFYIPPDVQKVYDKVKEKGAQLESKWNALLDSYSKKYPELAAEFSRRISGALPSNFNSSLFPIYKSTESAGNVPTRKLSQLTLATINKVVPEWFGGSADLNPSTLTYIEGSPDFLKKSFHGRNIRFGVREHAMAAICNGIAAHGGLIPFCSTFLNFIGYAWGSVILSSLSGFRVVYIMTHDSIGLGEDGPTHQPVEKYMMCRACPNLLFIRPCDGNEVVGAYLAALQNTHGPTVLSLTRQNIKTIPFSSSEGVSKGAYLVAEEKLNSNCDLILVSSGSEVSLCVTAKEKLEKENEGGKFRNVRVVSMPSWEMYEKQGEEYKQNLFGNGKIPILSVEAGVTTGWERYAHGSLGINRFGMSGPYEDVYVKLGLSVDNIVSHAKKLRAFYEKRDVPDLVNRPWNSCL